MSKYQRHLYLSIVFYKYLNKMKHPNALESLTEDNIYTVFKDFNYLCKDPFYKTIFSQVVKYSHQEMKEALIALQKLQLNTIDDLKEYFIELVEDKQSVDYAYYKMVKEVVLGIVNKKGPLDIYDPTLGYANYLIEAEKRLSINQFYGEEIDYETFVIAKMNMVIQGIDKQRIHFKNTNVVTETLFLNKLFDVIVSEPPYETPPLYTHNDLFDIRFSPYVNYSKRSLSDFSYILHSLSLLKKDGIFIIVCSPRLLFTELNSGMRQALIKEHNCLDGMIKLPKSKSNSLTTPMYLLIFRKDRDQKNTIYCLDADKLSSNHGPQSTFEGLPNKVIDIYNSKNIIEGISKFITIDEIKKNGYNLNFPRYFNNYKIVPRKSIEALLNDNQIIESEISSYTNKIKNILNKIS